MFQILLDRSCLAYARIFEWKSKSVVIDGRISPNKLVEIVRTPLPATPDFVANQRGALIAIAISAKSQNQRLFISRLSFDEGYRVAQWPDLTAELDIFSNLQLRPFEWAKLPFDYAKIPGFYSDSPKEKKDYKRKLCSLIGPESVSNLLAHKAELKLTDKEVMNLQSAAAIWELAKPTGKHIMDIFQFWTASANHLKKFLTCDKNFVRYIHNRKNPLAAVPILPSDFCRENHIPYRALDDAAPEDFYLIEESPLSRMINAHADNQPTPRSTQTINE